MAERDAADAGGIHAEAAIARLDLAGLERAIRTCPRCPLRESRRLAVPGEGPRPAPVMFVGESPGEKEDATGRPFVGNAGRLFDSLLLRAGLRREEVFLTNAVKCRPPGNRSPRPAEVEACRCYLRRQIELVDPAVICPLGRHGLRAVLGREEAIAPLRSRPFEHDGRTVLAMYHPAAAFYRPELKAALEEDMRRLLQLLGAVGREDFARRTPN